MTDDDWTKDMDAFHKAHGGVMQINVVRQEHSFFFMQRALAGSAEDEAVVIAINDWMIEAPKRGKHERLLCANCETTFHARRLPAAMVVVMPFANISHAIATGICRRCADCDDEALAAIAVNNMRRLYPDAYVKEFGQAQ
jgi:hypothetical protein